LIWAASRYCSFYCTAFSEKVIKIVHFCHKFPYNSKHPATKGLPFDTQGRPSGIKGLPFGMKGFPSDVKGAPFDMRGIPSDAKRLPSGMAGIPFGVKGFPFAARGIPFVLKGIPSGLTVVSFPKAGGAPNGFAVWFLLIKFPNSMAGVPSRAKAVPADFGGCPSVAAGTALRLY
jgi:hypothetical protein